MVAPLVTRGRQLGLSLAPQADWHDLYGRLMLRLELPACAVTLGGDPLAEALALGRVTYGQAMTPTPTRWIYGPSPRHAVDRAAAPSAQAAPFLRFERAAPQRPGEAPSATTIELYRAMLAGDATPNPRHAAALVWLSIAALRELVGGLSLSDLLARGDVSARFATGITPPNGGLVYLPSEYGERQLLRVAAKYGEDALFSAPAI